METSTHTVFLGEVTDGDVLETAPAMTYAYYHNVIKGKSPKNAPTYLPEEEEAEPSAAGCAASADTCMTARFPSRTAGGLYLPGMPAAKIQIRPEINVNKM